MRKTYKIKRVNKKKGGENVKYYTERVKFLSDTFSEDGPNSLIKILNHLKQYEDTGLTKKLYSNSQLFEKLQIPVRGYDSSLQKLGLEFKPITEDIKKIEKIEKDDGSTDGSTTDGSTTDDSTDGSEHGIRGKTSILSKFQNYIKSDTKKSYYAIPKNIDDLIEIVKYINSEIRQVKRFTPEDKKTLDNAYLANIQIKEFLKKNLSSYKDTLKAIEIEDVNKKRNETVGYGGAKYKNTRKRNKTHKSKK